MGLVLVVGLVDNNLIISLFVNKRKKANVSIILKTKLMMNRKSTHVIPNPSGGWKVTQSGASRATNLFVTRQPAIDRARELSARQHTELVVHNKDGKISGKDSHGHDPYPPRG